PQAIPHPRRYSAERPPPAAPLPFSGGVNTGHQGAIPTLGPPPMQRLGSSWTYTANVPGERDDRDSQRRGHSTADISGLERLSRVVGTILICDPGPGPLQERGRLETPGLPVGAEHLAQLVQPILPAEPGDPGDGPAAGDL